MSNKLHYVPCFEYYCSNRHPFDEIDNCPDFKSIVNHLKTLFEQIITCSNILQLKLVIGAKGGIDRLPNSGDGPKIKKLMSAQGYSQQIYKIDYGNSKYKIYYGIRPESRKFDVLIIDANHIYFN